KKVNRLIEELNKLSTTTDMSFHRKLNLFLYKIQILALRLPLFIVT
ncbi:16514_t:CDS:1, partial [Dentiscutata erythropus]